MGCVKVETRTNRDDPVRTDCGVRPVIMADDMIEMDCLGDTGPLVEVAGVGPKCRVIQEAGAVAFEMAMIDGVEAHQCGEKTPVRQGGGAAHQEALVCEAGFEPVETIEQRGYGGVIGRLGGRKA